MAGELCFSVRCNSTVVYLAAGGQRTLGRSTYNNSRLAGTSVGGYDGAFVETTNSLDGYIFDHWEITYEGPSPRPSFANPCYVEDYYVENPGYPAGTSTGFLTVTLYLREQGVSTNYIDADLTIVGNGRVTVSGYMSKVGDNRYRLAVGPHEADFSGSISLLAVPDPGWKFKEYRSGTGWSSNRPNTTVTYRHAAGQGNLLAHITAYFEQDGEYFTLTLIPKSAGVCNGGGIYRQGDEVVIDAVPAANINFCYWLNEDGDIIHKFHEFKFAMPNRDVTLYARFGDNMIIYGKDGFILYGAGSQMLYSGDNVSGPDA